MGLERWPALLGALALVTVAAATDLRRGRIPNVLTLGGLGCGIAGGLVGGGPGGLLSAVGGALAAALVPLLLFRAGALGGGDVKLFAALGALLGSTAALEAETLAFAFGALWGVGRWVRRGQLVGGLRTIGGLALPFIGRRLSRDPRALEARKTTIRLGPAVAVATYCSVAAGVLG